MAGTYGNSNVKEQKFMTTIIQKIYEHISNTGEYFVDTIFIKIIFYTTNELCEI